MNRILIKNIVTKPYGLRKKGIALPVEGIALPVEGIALPVEGTYSITS